MPFFKEECQLINVEEIKELENGLFQITKVIT